MGHWGGSQPNAGRKVGSKNKRTIQQEEALHEMREAIRARWDELLSAKFELANGVYYEKEDKDGKVRIYKKGPDGQSLEYLFSMVVGKPKDIMEVGTKDGLPIELKISLDEAIKKIYGGQNTDRQTSD